MLCTDEPWTACDVCLLWLALCICHVIYTQHYNVTELDSWTICKSFATASEKWAIHVYGTMGVYIYIYCLFKAYLGQLLDLPGALGPHLKGTETLLAKKLINSYSKVVSMAASFGLVVVIVILSTQVFYKVVHFRCDGICTFLCTTYSLLCLSVCGWQNFENQWAFGRS